MERFCNKLYITNISNYNNLLIELSLSVMNYLRRCLCPYYYVLSNQLCLIQDYVTMTTVQIGSSFFYQCTLSQHKQYIEVIFPGKWALQILSYYSYHYQSLRLMHLLIVQIVIESLNCVHRGLSIFFPIMRNKHYVQLFPQHTCVVFIKIFKVKCTICLIYNGKVLPSV